MEVPVVVHGPQSLGLSGIASPWLGADSGVLHAENMAIVGRTCLTPHHIEQFPQFPH